MPPLHLLIKPASSLCSLSCDYCFYLDTASNRLTKSYGIMSLETLENILEKALFFAEDSCTIAYQGGEPTLAGLDFFKASVQLQKKHNKKGLKIDNALQTNGIAINEEWACFLRDNHFLTGVSLDGTRDCHNAFRKGPGIEDSWSLSLKGIECLKKAGAQFNILTVVNSVTAKRIQSVYSFFKKNGFEYLQFIPCLAPIGYKGEKLPFVLKEKDWGSFLCMLFDLWYRDFIAGTAPHIRQFENYLELILGLPPESCGISGLCSVQNVIEADGSCYPCDFYVLDGFSLGNLNLVDFESINQRRRELRFLEDSADINLKCRSCPHLFLCRGGCKRYCQPLTKEGRSLNILCKGYERFFEYSTARLHSLARALAPRFK